jgi:hypothetical protein
MTQNTSQEDIYLRYFNNIYPYMPIISRIIYSHRPFQVENGIYARFCAHMRATYVINFILLYFIVPFVSGEANEI